MKRFSKAQISALAATGIDFGVLILAVETARLPYPAGVALGALSGAAANFLLNRHWSFQAGSAPIRGQAFRYFLVSAGSLLLNTLGVVWFTEGLGLHYVHSKIVVAIVIGVFFNYPLHRDFVYRRKTGPIPRTKEVR